MLKNRIKKLEDAIPNKGEGKYPTGLAMFELFKTPEGLAKLDELTEEYLEENTELKLWLKEKSAVEIYHQEGKTWLGKIPGIGHIAVCNTLDRKKAEMGDEAFWDEVQNYGRDPHNQSL